MLRSSASSARRMSASTLVTAVSIGRKVSGNSRFRLSWSRPCTEFSGDISAIFARIQNNFTVELSEFIYIRYSIVEMNLRPGIFFPGLGFPVYRVVNICWVEIPKGFFCSKRYSFAVKLFPADCGEIPEKPPFWFLLHPRQKLPDCFTTVESATRTWVCYRQHGDPLYITGVMVLQKTKSLSFGPEPTMNRSR